MIQNVPFQHFPVVCICWTSTCMCPAYVALGISACKPEAIFARIQLPTALCGASVTTYVPSDHDQLFKRHINSLKCQLHAFALQIFSSIQGCTKQPCKGSNKHEMVHNS